MGYIGSVVTAVVYVPATAKPKLPGLFTGHDPARGLGQEVSLKTHGSSRVGSDQEVVEISRVIQAAVA